MQYPKTQLIRSYKNEPNPKVKERLLLILKVKFDKVIPAYAADNLHRSRPWALYWLDRFNKERIGGLKDRSKSGRPAGIPEEISYQIKKELLSRKEGWTTKQVEELIVKKSGGIRYHYTHIYRILRKWGFKQKVPRKVHVNTATRKEKDDFKKRPQEYLWIKYNGKGKKIMEKEKTLP